MGMNHNDEFLLLLNYGLKLSAEVRGQQCTHVQQEASGFLLKQMLHGYSIWQILNPLPRPELTGLIQGVILLDFSTLHCTIRVMFELDVNMWNVTSNYATVEEGDVWLEMWGLHSEYKRWELVRSSRSLGGELDKIEHDLLQRVVHVRELLDQEELVEARQSIESKLSSVENNVRTGTTQSHYRYWKSPKTVVELAQEEGYHEYHAAKLYTYGSQYIHSYSYSLSQVLLAEEFDDCKRLHDAGVFNATMLLALTIDRFWKVYPRAKTTVLPDATIVDLVNFYVHVHGIDLHDAVAQG